MKHLRNVMVDLETLGSTPGCAILSIGAVEFFPHKMELGKEFYMNVDLQSCLDYGLKVEGETFYWWMTQTDQARRALTGLFQSDLDRALEAFAGFIYPSPLIWGHGPSFDLSVLAVAYQAVGRAKPWAFRDERDTRTVLDLAGMKMPKIEGAHHALEDAKNQALTMMTALLQHTV